MSDYAISVEGLSKRYYIGASGQKRGYKSFRDVVAQAVSAPLRAIRRGGTAPSGKESFWALQDVSFKVNHGEVLGVIGRNGAGKSTLLKLLSRITEPTKGEIRLRGRVGSLLEVGTGFHPELTGRENVFLNGAVLGMRRHEIARKFDEIVAFAEVEKFIETPVKHYSSGMYLRLAFAVAAHLEPEILLVDEVLAVGDAAFQKKCLGKMSDVAGEGRTVLFVSHNMAAVENLCKSGIVLQHGGLGFAGSQIDAINYYLRNALHTSNDLNQRPDRKGSGEIRVVGIDFRDTEGNLIDSVGSGQTLDIHLHYEAKPGFQTRQLSVGIAVTTQMGVPVFLHHNRLSGNYFEEIPTKGSFILRLPNLPLPPTTYSLTYSLIQKTDYLDTIQDAAELTVIEGDFFGIGEVPPATRGVALVRGEWRVQSATQGVE